MNIFFIDKSLKTAAHMMTDKHIIKMCTESAQMLSTAHRILDGKQTTGIIGGKKKTVFLMPDEFIADDAIQNKVLHSVTHANHPSNSWTRLNTATYMHHVEILIEMLCEYTTRYKRIHAVESELLPILIEPPKNLKSGNFIEPPQTIGDQYLHSDLVEGYRRFYAATKWGFAKWKHDIIPEWFIPYMEKYWHLNPNQHEIFDKIAKKSKLPLDERIYSVALSLKGKTNANIYP